MKKKKGLFRLIVSLIVLVAICGLAVSTYYYMDETKSAKEQIDTLTAEKYDLSKTAYIALTTIRAGERLVDGENVECRQIYTGVDAMLFYTPSEEVSIATTTIEAGTPIFTSMVSDGMPAADERDIEISVADLMTTQADYDYIDLRISYPDGSDYVVLPKKMIKNLSLETCVFTVSANESDIQKMTSAILDAYLITGARLYTTKYTDANLQEAAESTYPVKSATLNMLSKNNNVNISEAISIATLELNKQARISLEERLGLITQEEAQAAKEAWTAMQQTYSEEVQRQLNLEAEYDYGEE